MLALSVGTASMAAQLTLLPVFCTWRRHPPVAGQVERAAQWAILVATCVAVFVPTDFPSLVLLVLPVLAWGAVRSGPLEALAQMIVVVGLAITLTTYGFGPFSRPDQRFDVPVDVQGILLATFTIVCALVVLTLSLTVGEQYENARQFAAERDRMQNVVDGITGVAIIGADLQGRITLFNPGAQRLLGYRAEEVLGQPTRMLHSDRGVAEKAAELGVAADYSVVAQTLIGRGPNEMGFVRKDGEERRHRMSLNRVIDDRGQVIGYVSTSEDITERLRAEARVLEALETERQAGDRLREVDRVKDAFVSSVSHELRTPITSILGYTELLEEGSSASSTPGSSSAVGRIGTNSNRLLTLIYELLTLSRVQADGIGSADQVVDLAQVVTAGLAVLSPTVARRHVELTVVLPSSPVPVTGDRRHARARGHQPDRQRREVHPRRRPRHVALTSEPGSAVLEVADTGIGVPAHEQQRLFDRFFRSSLAQQRRSRAVASASRSRTRSSRSTAAPSRSAPRPAGAARSEFGCRLRRELQPHRTPCRIGGPDQTGLAYAATPVSSRTQASSPTVQASCPGSMTTTSPGPTCISVPSSITNRHLPGNAETGVMGLAALGAGNGLDVVGPAPARLEDPAAQREVAHGDDIHVAVVLERTRLVRVVDVAAAGRHGSSWSVGCRFVGARGGVAAVASSASRTPVATFLPAFAFVSP